MSFLDLISDVHPEEVIKEEKEEETKKLLKILDDSKLCKQEIYDTVTHFFDTIRPPIPCKELKNMYIDPEGDFSFGFICCALCGESCGLHICDYGETTYEDDKAVYIDFACELCQYVYREIRRQHEGRVVFTTHKSWDDKEWW